MNSSVEAVDDFGGVDAGALGVLGAEEYEGAGEANPFDGRVFRSSLPLTL